MDDLDELTLVLAVEAGHVSELQVTAGEDLAAAHATSAAIDDLKARTRALTTALNVEATTPTPTDPVARRQMVVVQTWDELVARAQAVAADEGNDLGSIELNDLLRPGEGDQLDRLHTGAFRLDVRLDPYDLVAAVVAGIAAVLVDIMVVRVPTTTFWQGEWDSGSLLTAAMRSHAVGDDNLLSRIAKVPYDRVVNTGITGMGPLTHRVQTFGHDPLFGWVLGTMDIMRGTLTGASAFGEVRVINAGGGGYGLLSALALQGLHLVSDVGTWMGLPLPGWTALLAIPWRFGPDDVTVAEIARWMYLKGYGSWHLLTMATAPATAEAVVRTYIGARRFVDPDYNTQMKLEAMRTGATRTLEHPRYRAISLLAHAIATAGNAGRFLVRGNPLTLNYVQWLVFSKRLLQSLNSPTPTDLLTGQQRANRMVINTGWVELGISEPGLPTLDQP